jgi:hypothetical protein
MMQSSITRIVIQSETKESPAVCSEVICEKKLIIFLIVGDGFSAIQRIAMFIA